LTLTVSNEDYSRQPASIGTGVYEWDYVVEPERTNYLEVSLEDSTIDDSSSTYTWYVLDEDSSEDTYDTLNGKTGTQIDFVPSMDDSGRVFGLAVVRTDSDGATVSSQRFAVACKYVRREFRELCDKDRVAYFDALSTMYHTTTSDGQDIYGSKFRGSDYFIKKHLGAMTLEGCTPWHDSEVFVTAHAAFNLEYEGSLRSINASLSAHYWEISEDTTKYGEYWATESPIFTADMFGSYNTSEHQTDAYIADGRFSDVSFPLCDTSEDSSCPEHSIFGYMIDSNSYQPDNRLQRSVSVCGMPTTSKLAGCKFAERALGSENLRLFWANVELRYHGDQHALIGGARDCKFEAKTELSSFSHNATVMKYAEDIMLYMTIWYRDLFSMDTFELGMYSGTVSCPHDSATSDCTDHTDCTCTLPTVLEAIDNGEVDLNYAINVLVETELYEDIAGAVGWPSHFVTRDDGDDVSTENWDGAFPGLDTAQTEALLIFLAKQAAYQPRMLSSYSLSLGSVNDPIFWGAHNSWERMWHYKRIESETADATEQHWWNVWNETDVLDGDDAATCSWSGVANSTLPFYDLMEDEATENKYYTNKDMLRMFHPNNKKLPHVYDSLEYNHCDTSDAEADAEANADEDEDEQRSELRVNLMSSYRRKVAERYGAKVQRGYTAEEAASLNRYYDSLFDVETLDNYGDRPQYTGTYDGGKGGEEEDSSSSSSSPSSARDTVPDGLTLDDIVAEDWYIYKITATVRPAMDLKLYHFVNRYLMPDAFGMESVGCNSTHLGGAYKATFTAPGDASNNNQLHWVSGPIMNGAEVAAKWVDKILQETVGTTESVEGMGLVYDSDTVTPNAFMHNKVQFWVPRLDGFAKQLEDDGVPHLKRRSYVATSATDRTRVELAHLSVPVESKTYEIVGPLNSLSDTSGYDKWSDYECPSCHFFAEDLETLQTRYDETPNTTVWYSSETGDLDGRGEPMLVSIHVAASENQTLDELRPDFAHLQDFTHAKWELASHDEGTCNVASLSWESMPGVVIKYVQNTHEKLPAKGMLAEYEQVWHDEYQKAFYDESETHDLPSSANWHHFLDQHIGITGTQGDNGGYCDLAFGLLSQGLRDEAVGYSTRDESDEIHMYVGYEGTSAWEYNLASGCDSTYSFGDICGCVAENSVDVYNRRKGEDVDSCPKHNFNTGGDRKF